MGLFSKKVDIPIAESTGLPDQRYANKVKKRGGFIKGSIKLFITLGILFLVGLVIILLVSSI